MKTNPPKLGQATDNSDWASAAIRFGKKSCRNSLIALATASVPPVKYRRPGDAISSAKSPAGQHPHNRRPEPHAAKQIFPICADRAVRGAPASAKLATSISGAHNRKQQAPNPIRASVAAATAVFGPSPGNTGQR